MGAGDLLASLAAAGLKVTAEGENLLIQPASKLTDATRAALRDTKPVLLAILHRIACARDALGPAAHQWPDAEVCAYLGRRSRLVCCGWPLANAEALAARLVQRDREQDERVSCADCGHYRRGKCGNYVPAGLSSPEVGMAFAMLLQRCPGFGSPSA